jgi:hypothetical protein
LEGSREVRDRYGSALVAIGPTHLLQAAMVTTRMASFFGISRDKAVPMEWHEASGIPFRNKENWYEKITVYWISGRSGRDDGMRWSTPLS